MDLNDGQYNLHIISKFNVIFSPWTTELAKANFWVSFIGEGITTMNNWSMMSFWAQVIYSNPIMLRVVSAQLFIVLDEL